MFKLSFFLLPGNQEYYFIDRPVFLAIDRFKKSLQINTYKQRLKRKLGTVRESLLFQQKFMLQTHEFLLTLITTICYTQQK